MASSIAILPRGALIGLSNVRLCITEGSRQNLRDNDSPKKEHNSVRMKQYLFILQILKPA